MSQPFLFPSSALANSFLLLALRGALQSNEKSTGFRPAVYTRRPVAPTPQIVWTEKRTDLLQHSVNEQQNSKGIADYDSFESINPKILRAGVGFHYWALR
jgi:hypothetical protein